MKKYGVCKYCGGKIFASIEENGTNYWYHLGPSIYRMACRTEDSNIRFATPRTKAETIEQFYEAIRNL